jgi:hypothetical protein
VFAVGVLSAALLTVGTAAASAAEPNPNPPKATTQPKATLKPNPHMTPCPHHKMCPHRVSITTRSSEVKAGENVKFTGTTDGLKIGSPVVLERYYGGKWMPLAHDIRTTIKQGNIYDLITRLDNKGPVQLRARSGDAVSQTVTVTVK